LLPVNSQHPTTLIKDTLLNISKQRAQLWLWILVIAFFLLRLAFIGQVELTVDETYYWEWAKDLQMSYLDHPPMVAYSIAATTMLSDSELFVRLSALILSAATSIVFFYLAFVLFESAFIALFSTFLINVSLLFFAGGIIVTPDTPQIFFWTLFLLLFYTALEKDRLSWWVLAGIVLGCTFLSKYTGVFVLASAFLYLLWEGRYRKQLIRPGFYLMGIVALILFLPVVYWNYTHEWASFAKQFSHGFSNKGYGLRFFGEFLGAQAGLVNPFFFIAGMIALWQGFKFTKSSPQWKFCIIFFLPTFLFFLEKSLTQRVEGNWAAIAYMPLFIMIAVLFTYIQQGIVGGKVIKKVVPGLVWTGVLVGLLATGVAMAHVLNPFLPIPPKVDITKRLSGGKELALKVDEIYKEIASSQESEKEVFIFSMRHQLVSKIYYNLPDKQRVYYPEPGYRYPSIKTLPNKGDTGLFVIERKRDESTHLYFPYFENDCSRVGEQIIKLNGEEIWSYYFYKCEGYKGGLFDD